MSQKLVKFDNGYYKVNPRRFSIIWLKLWGIFPYPMIFSEWKWDTDDPLDPTTFKNNSESPEALLASDSEKEWRNFNGGVDIQLGGGIKQTGIVKWLPFITIGVVVIGLFFLYSTFNGKLGIIEAQIQSLGGMINNIK